MKKKLENVFSIENKILFPFVSITLVAITCLCVVFYRMEYNIKLEVEASNARALVGYINTDIDAGGYWQEPDALLWKYERCYQGVDLFLYDASGEPIFARRELTEDEIVLQDSDENHLGWRVLYSLSRADLTNAFIEEQRYVILVAVAVLLVIVEASVLIAHHISNPIWELSQLCTRISRVPEEAADFTGEHTHRHDEVGQLAAAFQAMMERLRSYTEELTYMKALNESIVENLPIGVIACDRERKIIFRNARADAMLERTGEADSQGRDLRAIVDEMVRKEEVLPGRADLRDSGGKKRSYELGAWKLRQGEDAEWGTLYTIDDVTYQRHMEEKMNHDEKLAYTGKLAADVAHEVRNPLAGIRAGLQVVDRKLTEDRDKLLCREMLKEVDRVNLLVENLVNLSRQRESEKTTVSLGTLSAEMGLLYSKVAENKGVRLDIRMEEGLWVLADEQEMRQILINLINNSIKALSRGGSITLTGCAGEEGVRITVADNGPGMAAEKLDQALQGEGGGQGLPIVRRLVEQNGGGLRFETSPGQGTRAILTFHGTGGIDHEV